MKKNLNFYYPSKLNTFAFIMCGFGDFFLALNAVLKTELHFKLGILSFLIAQLCFSYMYNSKIGFYKDALKFNFFHFFPYLLYGGTLLIILKISLQLFRKSAI